MLINNVRPYTRKELEAIANQLGTVYRQAETDILRILAKGNISEWKGAFLRTQLRQVDSILSGLETASREWAETHIPNLYMHNLHIVDAAARLDLPMTAIHQEAIAQIARTVVEDLDHVTGGVGRAVRDAYREATLQGISTGTGQGETRREVSKRIIGDLKERGVTGFTDKAGREWAMADYADMAARTTTREASWQGTANRMLEVGLDLVEISEHAESCELCAPWQGQVVSMTGETEGYPTLAEAEAEGFGHPNCVHDILPYLPEEAAQLGYE
jgi:hypothetical protein